jgi:hypothetical protein
VASSCEHGNKPSSSIKDSKFLDKVNGSSSRRTLVHGVGYSVS